MNELARTLTTAVFEKDEMTQESTFSEPADRMNTARCPKRVDGLDVSSIDGGFMIYQAGQNRVHYLNHTTVLILELCNGQDSVEKIAAIVQDAYGLSEAPESEVRDIVSKMEAESLVIMV